MQQCYPYIIGNNNPLPIFQLGNLTLVLLNMARNHISLPGLGYNEVKDLDNWQSDEALNGAHMFHN